MNDVPRNKNGWPTVEPRFFTEEQLRKEGERWRLTALGTETHTVAYHEWNKYALELCSRGFIDRIDVTLSLL